MARPIFLGGLPRSASVAYDFIRSGVRKGISARAMEPIIRDKLTPISRTTINRVVALEKQRLDRVADLRFLNRNARPNIDRMNIPIGEKMKFEFAFTFEVRYKNPFTGEDVIDHRTLSTNEVLTRDEMESQLKGRYRESSPLLVDKDETLVLIGAMRRTPTF